MMSCSCSLAVPSNSLHVSWRHIANVQNTVQGNSGKCVSMNVLNVVHQRQRMFSSLIWTVYIKTTRHPKIMSIVKDNKLAPAFPENLMEVHSVLCSAYIVHVHSLIICVVSWMISAMRYNPIVWHG